MPSKIEILRQFTNLPATAEHQEEFDKQVNAKTDDRGVCLLIVAQLENELDRALDCVIEPPASVREALYEQDGPLSTFAREISMAAALEIIGPISRANLRIIRHVSNAFAHAKRPLKFSTTEVARVCADLKIINTYEPPVVMDQQPDLSPRARFENVVAATMLSLASFAGDVKGWTPDKDEPGDVLSTEPLP
jgi:hypothetical protein